MKNRILYYETSRGCPYRCDFCVSAGSEVTFLPLARVREDFERFLRADVMQVKLVDRTFNHPPDRAHDIFSALIELKSRYPRTSTNFHFELSADLLRAETIELLGSAPPGLIQVEIGVQSTHAPALCAVHRSHNTQKLLRAAGALCKMPNIHVHTDLIAGLPLEDYSRFAQSFNDVYALGAEQLQLGFLKVLPGTAMRETADQYGIVYTDYPPYEVLQTDTLSYDDLLRLHRIADTLEALHNSGHFGETLHVLTLGSVSAFALFEALAGHLLAAGYFSAPRRIADLFSMLLAFAQQSGDPLRAADALRYDWLCLQKPGRWPAGMAPAVSDAQRRAIRAFFRDACMIEKIPARIRGPAGRADRAAVPNRALCAPLGFAAGRAFQLRERATPNRFYTSRQRTALKAQKSPFRFPGKGFCFLLCYASASSSLASSICSPPLLSFLVNRETSTSVMKLSGTDMIAGLSIGIGAFTSIS